MRHLAPKYGVCKVAWSFHVHICVYEVDHIDLRLGSRRQYQVPGVLIEID